MRKLTQNSSKKSSRLVKKVSHRFLNTKRKKKLTRKLTKKLDKSEIDSSRHTNDVQK